MKMNTPKTQTESKSLIEMINEFHKEDEKDFKVKLAELNKKLSQE